MLPINNNTIQFHLTDAAFEQIKLIRDNDYTLEARTFRVHISGKGCDGFNYESGFSHKQDKDLSLIFKKENESIEVLLDPFTLYYCKEAELDYTINFESNLEGFEFRNKNEALYHGKFFQNEELVPQKDEL